MRLSRYGLERLKNCGGRAKNADYRQREYLTESEIDKLVAAARESRFMGHRSIANTVVYTAVADKRIRNIWSK